MSKKKCIFKALPIVAAAYGEKFGVRIAIGGDGEDASTDGKVINIPNVPDDYPNKDCLWGYLAHEAGHVRLTDFDTYAKRVRSGAHRGLSNVLEDARIERGMIDVYPGVRNTLNETCNYLKHREFIRSPSEGDHPAEVLTSFVSHWLRAKHLNQPLQDVLEKTQQMFQSIFPEGVFTRLNALLRKATTTRSTAECIELADSIMKMIEEEQEKEQEQPEGSNSQDDANNDSGDQSQDAGAQDGGSDNAGQSSQDSQGNDGQSGSSSADQGGDQTQGKGQGSGSSDSNAALQAVLSASDTDLQPDVMAALKAELEQAGEQGDSHYRTVRHAPDVDGDETTGRDLLSDVRSTTSRIRSQLYGLVQASQQNKAVTKRTGKRLDTNRLHRVVTGDTRVFRQNEKQKRPNTAVHILSDLSASMRGNEERVAREAAMAISMALEAIPRVNPAVSFFGWGHNQPVQAAVRHGQSVQRNASRFMASSGGTTPMAEAVWYAAYELFKCKEPRKMLIVVTDGQPDNVAATKTVLDLCESSGVELFGIGIQSQSVTSLFNQSIVISDVNDLKTTLFKLMKNSLSQVA